MLLDTWLEMLSWKDMFSAGEGTLEGMWPVGSPCQHRDIPEEL